jgi:hypothetical protein
VIVPLVLGRSDTANRPNPAGCHRLNGSDQPPPAGDDPPITPNGITSWSEVVVEAMSPLWIIARRFPKIPIKPKMTAITSAVLSSGPTVFQTVSHFVARTGHEDGHPVLGIVVADDARLWMIFAKLLESMEIYGVHRDRRQHWM